LQCQLVDLWQTILAVQRLGIDDDFFELGGDSLTGMQMVSKVQSLVKEILHVPALFEHSTIRSFAQFLESNYGTELHRRESLRDVTGPGSNRGLNPSKIKLVRDALASYPVADPSLDRPTRKNPSAIFILAPARSGTTLLRVILAGHPQLFSPQELHLLSHATMDERRFVISQRLQGGRLNAAIQALMTARGCSPVEAETCIRKQEESKLPVAEFYRELQSQISPRRLVDKTPVYAWHRQVLARAEVLFDQPLYIHLLRHPCGMIRSYEEMRLDQMSLVRRPAGVSLAEFAEALWLISHQNILEFLADIPRSRQLRLMFERLVEQPQEAVEKLCQFLDLEYHPGMLEPYAEQHKRMTAPLHPAAQMIGDPKFHQHQSINPAVASRWRESYLTDPLPLFAETWRIAELLGYGPAPAANRHTSF
jgi:hypothetical protein